MGDGQRIGKRRRGGLTWRVEGRGGDLSVSGVLDGTCQAAAKIGQESAIRFLFQMDDSLLFSVSVSVFSAFISSSLSLLNYV